MYILCLEIYFFTHYHLLSSWYWCYYIVPSGYDCNIWIGFRSSSSVIILILNIYNHNTIIILKSFVKLFYCNYQRPIDALAVLPTVACSLLWVYLLPYTVKGWGEHAIVTFHPKLLTIFVFHWIFQHLWPKLQIHRDVIDFEFIHLFARNIFYSQSLFFWVPK